MSVWDSSQFFLYIYLYDVCCATVHVSHMELEQTEQAGHTVPRISEAAKAPGSADGE